MRWRGRSAAAGSATRSRPAAACSWCRRNGTAWQQALQPLIGAPWLDLPWYEAEAAFYLRVLAATGYYERAAPGYGRDPFASLKHAELERNGPRLAAELAGAALPVLLRSSLWGNRVDLSNYEIDRGHAGAVIAAAAGARRRPAPATTARTNW